MKPPTPADAVEAERATEFLADYAGGPAYLRLTRPLAEGMVVTIEPGLYFIPMLLQELAAAPEAAHVDWARVEALKPYGGIRIEDDVACRAGGAAPENFTRDAFAGLQP